MKKRFIRTRKARYGGIAAVLTVLVVTVTVLFNTVFGTLVKRYQWYGMMVPTELTYEVSEDCYEILGAVFENGTDKQVEIIFCDLEENVEADSTLCYVYETATSIAERYPDNLTVSFHDIWTNPNTVKQYTTAYNPATGETEKTPLKSTSVIIVSDGYHRAYDLSEFFAFKDGNTSDVWAYNGERKLTAGILRAVDADSPVVCLTENHGETYYDYELLYLLDDAGYSITYIDLYNDEIPENCDLIISYNPKSDLVADEVSEVSEIDILDAFLSEDGNSFLVLVDNTTPDLPNYEAYLEGWGVHLNEYTDVSTGNTYRYMVQDSANSLTSDGYTVYGDAVDVGSSAEMLEGLQRRAVFKNATSMSAASGFINNGDGSYTKGDRTLYSLYEGSDEAVSWANGRPVGDAEMLMTLTEQKNDGASSYVGVLSSVRFCTEEFMQSAVHGNSDAFLRLFRNVGKTLTPEGLTVQPFNSQDISTVTTSQMLYWTLGLTLTPAVTASVIAIAVLVKRRRA